MTKYENLLKFQKNRKEQILYVMGGKCSCCGYNKCSKALELHHLNPENKEFTISSNMNMAWENLVKELPKTILVCANCHREIHTNLIDNNILQSSFDQDKANEVQQIIIKNKSLKEGLTGYCKICNKKISYGSIYCNKCAGLAKRAKKRPEKEELEKIIKKNNGNFCAVGRIFGITDNGIRKWCKDYGLPYHSKDYK